MRCFKLSLGRAKALLLRYDPEGWWVTTKSGHVLRMHLALTTTDFNLTPPHVRRNALILWRFKLAYYHVLSAQDSARSPEPLEGPL
jgi:hypothetical protein